MKNDEKQQEKKWNKEIEREILSAREKGRILRGHLGTLSPSTVRHKLFSPYSGKPLSYRDLERDYSLGKKSLGRLFKGSLSKLEKSGARTKRKEKNEAELDRTSNSSQILLESVDSSVDKPQL